MKTVAIVLSGGCGKRMGSDIPKQYIEVKDKPLLYYTLIAFEKSKVDEIVVVANEEYVDYVHNNILSLYDFKKVTKVIKGGKERYDSVYEGLVSIEDCDIVTIHDGARPMITADIINASIEDAKKYKASVVAVPSKDTVKIVDEDGFCKETPDRKCVWNIQTPQSFQYELIKNAHDSRIKANDVCVTDDAMLIERYTETKVHICMGSYLNIKITTPEDMIMANQLL